MTAPTPASAPQAAPHAAGTAAMVSRTTSWIRPHKERDERREKQAARVERRDVLDAAAAAWSADRIARGLARSLPDPPEEIRGRKVAIWI
jgi:predicted RNase H-like nuclease